MRSLLQKMSLMGAKTGLEGIKLYDLHHHYFEGSNEAQEYVALIETNQTEKYEKAIALLPIEKRVELLEMLRVRTSLLGKCSFGSVFLKAFTQNVKPEELKYLHMRLSYLYVRSKFDVLHCPEPLAPWTPYFSNYLPYYQAHWQEQFADYLVSLMCSKFTLMNNEEAATLMTQAAKRVLEKGMPPELQVVEDGYRVVLKKIRYLEYIDLFRNVSKKLFVDMCDPGLKRTRVQAISFLSEYVQTRMRVELAFSPEELARFHEVAKGQLEATYREDPTALEDYFSVLAAYPLRHHFENLMKLAQPYISNLKNVTLGLHPDFCVECLYSITQPGTRDLQIPGVITAYTQVLKRMPDASLYLTQNYWEGIEQLIASKSWPTPFSPSALDFFLSDCSHSYCFL